MSNLQRYSRKESMLSHIQEWQTSKLTKKQYCEQNQVGIHAFNYWLKQINKKNRNTKSGFTEYKIVDRPIPSAIRLNFPNGVTADIPQNTDYKLVQVLINSWQPCLP